MEKLWLPNLVFVAYVHLVGAIGMVLYRPHYLTIILCAILWMLSGFGITMGYHRLWSHRSYKASPLLQVILAIMGTLAFQGSIKWWVTRHRLHHRYTDTEDDPYNAKLGLLHTHIGWIFKKTFHKKLPLIDLSDLDNNPIVRFQHRYYVQCAILLNFILPIALAHWGWDDLMGGFLFAAHTVKIFSWHATFSINSLAHWAGTQDYSRRSTARNNFLLALLTNGEGYHNFHHEFPRDYRNGIYWYDYDPTKWLIKLCSFIGLTWELVTEEIREIEKARIIMVAKDIKLEPEELMMINGKEPNSLPKITMKQYRLAVQEEGKQWIIIDGFVYDVDGFYDLHPGGAKILKAFIGRDASSAFNGGLTFHTDSAKRKAHRMIVAKIITPDDNEKPDFY